MEFPASTILKPLGFLVIPRDPEALRNAFGQDLPIASRLESRLDGSGAVLRLVRPGAAPGSPDLVDAVRYESNDPWPIPSVPGASLQRLSHETPGIGLLPLAWGAVNAQAGPGDDWKYVSVSGRPTGSTLLIQLAELGEVLLDEFNLVEGPIPGANPNLLANPGFESTGIWQFDLAYASSLVVGTDALEGRNALRLSATAAPSSSQAVRQSLRSPLQSGQLYTLSFWYKPLRGGRPIDSRFRQQLFLHLRRTLPSHPSPRHARSPQQPQSRNRQTGNCRDSVGSSRPLHDLHFVGRNDLLS